MESCKGANYRCKVLQVICSATLFRVINYWSWLSFYYYISSLNQLSKNFLNCQTMSITRYQDDLFKPIHPSLKASSKSETCSVILDEPLHWYVSLLWNYDIIMMKIANWISRVLQKSKCLHVGTNCNTRSGIMKKSQLNGWSRKEKRLVLTKWKYFKNDKTAVFSITKNRCTMGWNVVFW